MSNFWLPAGLFFFSLFSKCVEGGRAKALIAAPSCLHEYCSHQQDSSAARLQPLSSFRHSETHKHQRFTNVCHMPKEQMSLLKLNERRLLFHNLCNPHLSGLLGVWWAGETARVGVMWAWRLLLSPRLKYSWRCESRGNRGAAHKSRPRLIIALARARAHTHSHTRTSPHPEEKSKSPHLWRFFPFFNKDANEKFYSGSH